MRRVHLDAVLVRHLRNRAAHGRDLDLGDLEQLILEAKLDGKIRETVRLDSLRWYEYRYLHRYLLDRAAPGKNGSPVIPLKRSWFDLASFFLAREVREAVAGDIGEQRLKMEQQGYSKFWVEAVTAVQLIRSFFGSWSGLVKDLALEVIKRMLAT